MFRGFNLMLEANWFSKPEALAAGKEIFDANKRLAQQSLDSFKDNDGDLLAEKIMSDWFPDEQPHLFLSHSHKDSDHVIALAGWLKLRFGLTAFVDSCAWGYADKLLEQIDKKYCYQKDENTYNYQMRNKSTAHVHMMLSSSILRLINSSECVFFVNTPNSISTETFIKSKQTTASPWLYSELVASSLIQRRSPSQHRFDRTMIKSSVTADAAMESLDIKYPAVTHHLMNLNADDLQAWDDKVPKLPTDRATSLDVLYKLKP